MKKIFLIAFAFSVICMAGAEISSGVSKQPPAMNVVHEETQESAKTEPHMQAEPQEKKAEPVSEKAPQPVQEPAAPVKTESNKPVKSMVEPEAAKVVQTAKPVEKKVPTETVDTAAEEPILCAVDHAKTGGTEIIIDSAKTDPEVDVPVAEPQPSIPQEHADIQSAMAVANAYAQETYGVILDTSLGFDNSGYRFPGSTLATASQADVESKAKGIVDYTFNQLMVVNHKTIEDVRSAEFQCNVYIYEDDGTIYCYCFYA